MLMVLPETLSKNFAFLYPGLFHGCLLPTDMAGQEVGLPWTHAGDGCPHQNAGPHMEAGYILL